jgi:two-component system, cell cycle response regulator DivK
MRSSAVRCAGLPEVPAVKDASGPVILLVDGHRDNREMYTEYLRTRGYQVVPCANSKQCFDLAVSRRPDLILLELRMDGMSGIEVIAHLKSEKSLASVPVVALTASVLPFQRAEAMAAGFDKVIPKPCLPQDLVTEIEKILSKPA